MIQKYVDRFMAAKPALRERFGKEHVDNYKELVTAVIEAITDPDEYGDMDPKRVHEINDGDYQGTLVYVIGAGGYQPSVYWYTTVGYGSCTACDTLQSISGHGQPTEHQIDQYMTLALHIVQKLGEMGGDES